MATKRTLAALLLTLTVAATAAAQEAAPAEFGRASGGELAFSLRKSSSPLSGSLATAFPFGTRNGATLGGTLLKDRLWFFATAERAETPVASAVDLRSLDTNLKAQLGDRQSLGATYNAGQSTIPSSFLSLRYTGMVSSNMTFSATFNRSTQP